MQSARTLVNVNDMAITARNPLLDDSEANPAAGAGVEDKYKEVSRMSIASVSEINVDTHSNINFEQRREDNIKELEDIALETLNQGRGGIKDSQNKGDWIKQNKKLYKIRETTLASIAEHPSSGRIS